MSTQAPTTVIFTRYTIIADGEILFDGYDEQKAYRFFFDRGRFRPGVRDLQFVIKRRALPESGKYSDIEW